ncbi:MAG: DUF6378 domain-containing protein [Rubrimonas sp.]
MTARAILDEAAAVLEVRGKSYGDAAAAFAAIAERWSATLGRPVTPAQVVLCMVDLKLARLARDPEYRDSVVDVIGYAALLPEVIR